MPPGGRGTHFELPDNDDVDVRFLSPEGSSTAMEERSAGPCTVLLSANLDDAPYIAAVILRILQEVLFNRVAELRCGLAFDCHRQDPTPTQAVSSSSFSAHAFPLARSRVPMTCPSRACSARSDLFSTSLLHVIAYIVLWTVITPDLSQASLLCLSTYISLDATCYYRYYPIQQTSARVRCA